MMYIVCFIVGILFGILIREIPVKGVSGSYTLLDDLKECNRKARARLEESKREFERKFGMSYDEFKKHHL